MPYTKTITVFSKRERANLHRQGFWVDRDGNYIRVSAMTCERLERLVKMLATWAMDEDDPILYIKNLDIFPHVLARIEYFRMDTYQASMFKLASMLGYSVG